jgi:hypothetical protein
MPKLFKLTNQHFSKGDNEFKITFNKSRIIAITITDHWQKRPGRKWITKELILELLEKLNGWRLEPTKY